MTAPGIGDGVERKLLDVEANVAGDHVLDQTAIVLLEHVGGTPSTDMPRIARRLNLTASEERTVA
jgi:hypothetical protein